MTSLQPLTFGVLGAIVGDVVGSRHEFSPIKTTEFELSPDAARDSATEASMNHRGITEVAAG